MDLDRLNALDADEARQAFLDCCASSAWASAMTERRSFPGIDDLLEAAREEWQALRAEDRDEAFAAHPRIGETPETGDGGRHFDWSRREQSGTRGAEDDVRNRLAGCNREYERRFGRVFLVFATGRTAEELLALCEQRLANDPGTEFEVASAEQEKITDLRLRRLLGID